ncbi:hypothetical protein SKAU_G00316790 [Synaphobranchus kaupii]|uniref:Uncharacterized protein n=1 Tax=Synaphobranchus kaupii TaxID=118154 RepID=A0A9Q1ILX4_SYNKA|nr:hypothetical protein SKAU_G00316790 [Synaphobranchus kaupii]
MRRRQGEVPEEAGVGTGRSIRGAGEQEGWTKTSKAGRRKGAGRDETATTSLLPSPVFIWSICCLCCHSCSYSHACCYAFLQDSYDQTEEGSISFTTHTAKKRSSEPEPEDRWHDISDEDVQSHQFCFCSQRTPRAQLDH